MGGSGVSQGLVDASFVGWFPHYAPAQGPSQLSSRKKADINRLFGIIMMLVM
jgi:hypothetical protein